MIDAEALRINTKAEPATVATADSQADAKTKATTRVFEPTPIANWCVAMVVVLLVAMLLLGSPIGIGGGIMAMLMWMSLQLERLIAQVKLIRSDAKQGLLARISEHDKMEV